MRGRLVFPSIFSLGFTETTVKGRHGSTTVSQRAFSSWADEENPTSYGFSPQLLHCGQSVGPALGEPMHSAPPGQVGVLALVEGGGGSDSPCPCSGLSCSAHVSQGMSTLPLQAPLSLIPNISTNNHLAFILAGRKRCR